MTPEEVNRTMEFILQSQARLAAAQEQDREDRLQSEREFKAFDQRLAGLFEIQVRLLESQTRRLDEYEKEREEFRAEFRAIRVLLERIFDKITERLN
jgi:hypothetical protein